MKNKKKQYRKQLVGQQPPLYFSKGHWEEAMLENNSYYDIDILNKANRSTNKKLKEWEKKYDEASSWLGKWYCQVQIDKLNKRLHKYK